MSKRFHVNLETGETSRCLAEISCRLNPHGGFPHFSTIEDAQSAYGTHMKDNAFPVFKKEPESNSDAPPETQKLKRAGATILIENVPSNGWLATDIARFSSNYNEESKLYHFLMTEATDEQAELVLKSTNSRSALNRIVAASPNPNISTATRIKALKTSACFKLTEKMVKSSGFPTTSLIPHMSVFQRKDTARFTDNPEAIDEIVKTLETVDGRVYSYNAEIVDAAFKNPAVSLETKRALAQLKPSLNTLLRVEEAIVSSPRKFEGLIIDGASSDNSTVGSDAIVFDKKKVEDLGWTPNEVNMYVKHFLNREMVGGSYDHTTGVFKGFRD